MSTPAFTLSFKCKKAPLKPNTSALNTKEEADTTPSNKMSEYIGYYYAWKWGVQFKNVNISQYRSEILEQSFKKSFQTTEEKAAELEYAYQMGRNIMMEHLKLEAKATRNTKS